MDIKTGKSLGLTIPPSLLLRADQTFQVLRTHSVRV